MARDRKPPSVHHKLRPLAYAEVDVSFHPLQVLARDKGPHFRLGVLTGQDLERPDFVDDPFYQGVGDLIPYRDDHGNGHASFSRGAVRGSHQGIHCLIEVRVGHHHGVVFRAAQGLDTLAMGRCLPIHLFSDHAGPDETYRGYLRVRDQEIDRLLLPVHHVQNSRRQSRFGEQFGEPHRAGRVFLRGFQDKGVAAGDGDGKHPHRHHGREIERGDSDAYPERLPEGKTVDSGPYVFRIASFQQVGYAADELHHFRPPCQGTGCVA